MECFEFRKQGIWLKEREGEKLLLSFEDLLANKSRLPLAGDIETYALVPMLADLLEETAEDPACFLMDCLIARFHMRRSGPVRLLYLGEEGSLPLSHAGRLLSAFHPFSAVYPFSDEILLEAPGKDYFDLVVLEGNKPVAGPDQKLKTAFGLCKREGMLILHTADPLLDELFCLFHPDREDYEAGPGEAVRTVSRH